ncbi:efflux RND transporter periplasmic adaptor subunit [Deferribacter autotrophicus]|uniref:Efflux RND transporter periplasmic adaptor subunit n=1 Tax=Deferribacter autotrophicus TaxID=500465 RepID=A0A5A8F6Y4_9BACT|nr:efflux RND transporter periplasmic adaptor subunit [Deferribacter autotrophicus]KAA0259039.1 efflux RND transporter periplasmic adaptor subunit [Deferribacter autotrophicus]
MKNNNGYHKKTWLQRLISLIVIVLIIYAGLSVSKYLMKTRKKISRKKPKKMVTYVETVKGRIVDTNYIIYSFGNIYPAKSVTIYPEVSGKIKYINDKLLEGNYLKANELIAKIDDRDYLLNLKIKEANLNALYEDLKIELGKQKSAEKELKAAKNIIKNIDNESLYLILRKPYINKLKENIEIAKADLELAKLKLERTKIRSPFNAFVLKKYVDEGSYVTQGTKIADLIYADEFYLIALFPISELKWLDLKVVNFAKIIFDDGTVINGKIKSIEKAVDEKGLMVKAIISIKPELEKLSPVMIHNYANVEIFGKTLPKILMFPRTALKENNIVWINKDGKLLIKKIDVVFKNKDYVFTYDLSENDKIIVSNIAAPVENMPLKEVGKESE